MSANMRRFAGEHIEQDLLCIHISHIFAPVNLWTIISQTKTTHKGIYE